MGQTANGSDIECSSVRSVMGAFNIVGKLGLTSSVSMPLSMSMSMYMSFWAHCRSVSSSFKRALFLGIPCKVVQNGVCLSVDNYNTKVK